FSRDWSSDVCSSDLVVLLSGSAVNLEAQPPTLTLRREKVPRSRPQRSEQLTGRLPRVQHAAKLHSRDTRSIPIRRLKVSRLCRLREGLIPIHRQLMRDEP